MKDSMVSALALRRDLARAIWSHRRVLGLKWATSCGFGVLIGKAGMLLGQDVIENKTFDRLGNQKFGHPPWLMMRMCAWHQPRPICIGYQGATSRTPGRRRTDSVASAKKSFRPKIGSR